MSEGAVDVAIEARVAELGGSFTVHIRRAGVIGEDGNLRGLTVKLICRHDCRVDVRSQRNDTHATQTVAVDDKGAVDDLVALPVPADAPISFTGKVIRNLWRVEVSKDLARARDRIVTTIDVVVAPRGGAGVYSQPHPLRGRR